MVAGLYLSLEAPSATAVALCISHACLPKESYLKRLNVTSSWPIWGVPRRIHLDNAKEFHSEALERGCAQYGIELMYRPVATPHYGGHIERLIGTLMGKIHLLPGTTYSNVQDRGHYDSEKNAALTLSELEAWLALEICEKYHGLPHRTLGVPPITRWEKAFIHDGQLVLPPFIHDSRRFLIDFLPVTQRMVRRDGVHLFNIRYWDGVLAALIPTREKYLIRYDPRDLSHIYLIQSDGTYHRIGYAEMGRPPITRWEQKAALKALRDEGNQAINEHAIFTAIEKQRALIQNATEKSKAARRRAQRQSNAVKSPGKKSTRSTSSPTKPSVDYSQPVEPYDFEEWE